ncbi:hypothetical protein [Pseudostreptobacillus hongkongensis]|uniref:hypothetical protein n=1 Tax=Pseudostreptobacillus hongkongensis TaxID=1162717 RepID=UPI0028D0B586|nr:hypothetical protein [Pseudostreptobacillus hongkongensis]
MITLLISGQISYTYGVAQGLDSRDSIAITGGTNSVVRGVDVVAICNDVNTAKNNSIAIGKNATTKEDGGISIGANSISNGSNGVSVGSDAKSADWSISKCKWGLFYCTWS